MPSSTRPTVAGEPPRHTMPWPDAVARRRGALTSCADGARSGRAAPPPAPPPNARARLPHALQTASPDGRPRRLITSRLPCLMLRGLMLRSLMLRGLMLRSLMLRGLMLRGLMLRSLMLRSLMLRSHS